MFGGSGYDGVESHNFQYWRQAWHLVAVAYPQCSSCGLIATSSPSPSPTLQSVTGGSCGTSIASPELCAVLATAERCATEPEVVAICAAECCDPDAAQNPAVVDGDGAGSTLASSAAPTPAPALPAVPVIVNSHCLNSVDLLGETFCEVHATQTACLTNGEIAFLCAFTCCHLTVSPTSAPASSSPSTSPSQVPSYTGDCPIQIDLMILLGQSEDGSLPLPPLGQPLGHVTPPT